MLIILIYMYDVYMYHVYMYVCMYVFVEPQVLVDPFNRAMDNVTHIRRRVHVCVCVF